MPVGFLQVKSKKKLACNVSDSFATHASLLYGSTDTDFQLPNIFFNMVVHLDKYSPHLMLFSRGILVAFVVIILIIIDGTIKLYIFVKSNMI